ncbi:toprim domain-containing protein [Candidatus Pacearchaeota archaeon]|nr:MAG: toprim domain-containing protein [Candidatus Pacearchaeota archaeon]
MNSSLSLLKKQMKFNPKLRGEIEKYKGYVVLVEGKKDVLALRQFGFTNVYAIHKTGIGLRERVEQIVASVSDKKKRFCVLTDFDRQGKKLYMFVKSVLHEQGVRVDSALRGILLKAGLSHVEGFGKFMEKLP